MRAFYRVKVEGAVSIYNQGVLVRHDASHLWGAGGLIVSKKAIALNVSRTEILRKTCPVWKVVAKQFGTMADQIAAQLGDRRKTEARREKSARALLSGEGDLSKILHEEEVITILPGNRHITIESFLRQVSYRHKGNFCIIVNDFDVPKAETMARAKVSMFLHPRTLDRFGLYSPGQFLECLDQIGENYTAYCQRLNRYQTHIFENRPTLLDFHSLEQAFLEHVEIITEKDHLDKETRRVWTALRWCLQQYAAVCLGKPRYSNGKLKNREDSFAILLGRSNTADAWTDGKYYIAFNIEIIQRLKATPVKTAAYIFSLLEHEIAHEGDSLDAGHDEAFYQRYHDISIEMSEERQRYMHIWLMKYTTSLEAENKKAIGQAWSERYLIDRVGTGREKKGLPRPIEDVSQDPTFLSHASAEDISLITLINAGLHLSGRCPDEPDWDEVFKRSVYEEEVHISDPEEDKEMAEYYAYMDEMHEIEIQQQRERIAGILKVNPEELDEAAITHFIEKEEEAEFAEMEAEYQEYQLELEEEKKQRELDQNNIFMILDSKYHQYVREGETVWSLERNAAGAGFFSIRDYLLWRNEQ